MALTISIEGLGVLSDAENVTNWGIVGSGGVSFGTDTEIFYQGTACNSTSLSSAKNGWLYYNYGSAINFQTTYVGQKVYIWFNCTTVGAMNTKATPGLAVRMGPSTTAYRTWTLAGSDDLNGYKGGWKCAIVDPTISGSIADTGAYSATTVQYIGIYYNGSTASRSNNLFVDTIAVGKGIRVVGTSTTLLGDIVTYCAGTLATRSWGMVQQREGINYMYGKLFIGGSASVDTTGSTQGKVLQWGDSQYWNGSTWVTSIGNGFNGLTVEDHATHPTYFADGVIVGATAGRTGNVYIGSSTINTSFDVYGGNNAASVTYLFGSIFQSITGGFVMGNDADHKCYSASFVGCSQFNPVGSPQIRNCLFISTTGSTGALLWNENINISNCTFIANPTSAIQMPSAVGSPYAYNALFFSGNNKDVNNTSGSAITINKNILSDPTTYSGSTVTFAGTSVTTQITVTDIDTASVITGATVYVIVANGSNFPYNAVVTITGVGTTATVTHDAHGLATNDKVRILGSNQNIYNGAYTITVLGVSSYTYTTSSEITISPATGTITSTMVLIDTTTNGSGIASDTRTMANNQPITGWVRLATGGRYYKSQPISDTVDKNNGKSINVQLIPDT